MEAPLRVKERIRAVMVGVWEVPFTPVDVTRCRVKQTANMYMCHACRHSLSRTPQPAPLKYMGFGCAHADFEPASPIPVLMPTGFKISTSKSCSVPPLLSPAFSCTPTPPDHRRPVLRVPQARADVTHRVFHYPSANRGFIWVGLC